MKKVIVSVIMFAIGISLIISTIIPLVKHAKSTGEKAGQSGRQIAPALQNILTK